MKSRILGCLVTAVALALSSVATTGRAAAADRGDHDSRDGLVVMTVNGAIRGTSTGDVDSFLGIRYAAPPLGPPRWQPPQPAPRWSGVIQATSYGNRCAALASTNGPLSLAEDCLFLNVQRPAHTRPGERIPVYFFIHGGGNTNGSSNQHDGTKIVHEGHVIVVTINYRLGVLGSLGHPALTAEQGESGDYGFQDQQAALLWVHRNIAAFGGDPRQVTIGGQSSGAQSVCTHLSAPGSSGLFSAAIIQSAPDCFTDNPADAATEALGLASVVGCGDAVTALTCLRAADTQTLLNAGNDTSFSGFYTNGTRTIPIDPRQAIKSGAFRHVPTIIGFTRDEVRTFVVGDIGLSEQEYVDSVARDMGPISDQVLAHYPWPADADQFTPAYLRAAMFTDRYFACGDPPIVDDFASHTRTWVYEFDHRDGPGLQPNPVGYVWGAGHAVDLAYLWPSFDNGTPIAATFTPAEQQLAGQMVQYWSAFVKRSNPVVQGQAFWPRYNRSIQRLSLQAGNDTRAITDAEFSAEHQCDFWRSVSAPS